MTTGFGDYTIEIEADVAKLLSGQRAADAALKQIETSVKGLATPQKNLIKASISWEGVLTPCCGR